MQRLEAIGVLCCLLLAAAGTALAQENEARAYDQTIPVKEAGADPVPAERDAPTQLDDIVVTATKREQSTREIAGTVNALDGADLEKIGAREMQDFIALVPGITMQEGATNARRLFTIRGIGQADRANQTVGQLIGDVPMTDPYAAYVLPDLDPFDLRTVEVLKGPQGTVFGASALNGAIRYVPNTPELDEWSGRAFADYVSLKEGARAPTFGALLNAPIGEEFALRFSGVLQEFPGVYDNNARGSPDADRGDKAVGRLMARWQATDRLSLNALYLRQESDRHDRSVADNRNGQLSSDNRPGPSRFRLAFDLANLELRYAFDGATLIAQTSRLTKLQDVEIDGSDVVEQAGEQGLESLRVHGQPYIEGYVQELRLMSPAGGRWNWIGGIFLQDYKADIDLDVYGANTAQAGPVLGALPGGLGSPNGISAQRIQVRPLAAQEQALFGEATRKLGEHWEVTAGARLYRTRIDANVQNSGALEPSSSSESFHQKERGVSPKLAVAFQATGDILAYAAAARGFQFGGGNIVASTDPTVTIPPEYKSSTLWSYEAGVRSDWLGRTLRADLTVFLLDWSDAQISQRTPQPDDTLYIDNVGAVRSKGVEATFAWLTPVPGLSLESAASYIVAKTAETYKNESETVPIGTAMPAAPRLQTASTLAWNSFFGAWTAGAALVHTHTGKAYSDIFHAHEIYDYQTLSLNLNATRPDLRYAPALTLGITNLLDERGLLGRTGSDDPDDPDSVGGLASYYNRPRAISLRLTAEF